MLTDVLYAPKCPFTIISWRKFDEKGCRTVGYGGKFSVEAGLPKNGQPADTIFTAKIKESDKLYHVEAHLKKENHQGALLLNATKAQASPKKGDLQTVQTDALDQTIEKFIPIAYGSGKKTSKSASQNNITGPTSRLPSVFVLNAAQLHDLRKGCCRDSNW